MASKPRKKRASSKLHRGRIKDWVFVEFEDGHRMVNGLFLDHAAFAGKRGHTSFVLSHDEKTGEIETRNSRYTLVGAPESEPKQMSREEYSLKLMIRALEARGIKFVAWM